MQIQRKPDTRHGSCRARPIYSKVRRWHGHSYVLAPHSVSHHPHACCGACLLVSTHGMSASCPCMRVSPMLACGCRCLHDTGAANSARQAIQALRMPSMLQSRPSVPTSSGPLMPLGSGQSSQPRPSVKPPWLSQVPTDHPHRPIFTQVPGHLATRMQHMHLCMHDYTHACTSTCTCTAMRSCSRLAHVSVCVFVCVSVSCLQLDSVLATCDNWRFDAYALEEASQGHPLSVLGFWLFHATGLMRSEDLSRARLVRFLQRVEEGYSSANPYHNRRHAADVLQSMHVLLHQGGLAPGGY